MKRTNSMILMALCFCYQAIALGQSNYSDQRFRADSDPKTVEARNHFSSLMAHAHLELQDKFELHNVQLLYNPRMICQFGRGAETAFRVIPLEHGKIMGLISLAKKNPEKLLQLALVNSFEIEGSEEQMRKAIANISTIEAVYIDYWGYLSREYKPPVYSPALNRITFYATWHERESFYEATDPEVLRYQILKAFMHPETSFWDRFKRQN